MRPAERIKKMFAQSSVTVNENVNKKIIENSLSELEKQTKPKPASAQPNVWRIIMNSKISKLIAAVIVIAVLLGINYFFGPIDGTTVVLADVIENMKKMPWMHQVTEGFEKEVSGTAEQWIAFESKIWMWKNADGTIEIRDYGKHREHKYDPASNTVTISYIHGDNLPLGITSPLSALKKMIERFDEQGAEITDAIGEYGSKSARVKTISLSQNGRDGQLDLYVDLHSDLLLGAEIIAIDPNNDVVMQGDIKFDYPDSGPKDIYELGVPDTAKIINNLPAEDVLDVYENCQAQRKKREFGNYIAIITYGQLNGTIGYLDIIYNSGRMQRMERHSVFNTGEIISQKWPQYSKQLGDTLESMLKWAQEGKSTSCNIYLYDGTYSYCVKREDSGGWYARPRQHWSDHNPNPMGDLADLGWPQFSPHGRIIENDYASENSLICIERSNKINIHNSKIMSPSSRTLYFLNPQQDYICQKEVRYAYPMTLVEKGMFDANTVPSEPSTIREVTGFAQTEEGHWYPAVIRSGSMGWRSDYSLVPLTISDMQKIYVEFDPAFPEKIFDPESLPVTNW